MISDIIRYNLIQDYTDRDPQTLADTYPTVFPGGSGDVPEYLHSSLKTIWVGVAGASSDLESRVIAMTGIGDEDSAGTIVISNDSNFPSSEFPRGMRSDDPGAEVMMIKIILYGPRKSKTLYKDLQNAARRIRYLLDFPTRSSVRGLKGDIDFPSSSYDWDKSVDPDDYLRCWWQETSGVTSYQNQKHNFIQMSFMVEYVRIFLP